MKTGYSHIEVLIDRSGSMHPLQADVIGGFNRFLSEQRSVAGVGRATISLTQFDHEYEPNYQMKDIREADALTDKTYVPRGSTALLDALGKTIVALGEKLSSMSESQRPEKVIFMVQTDGLENASHEYTLPRIKEMVKVQTETYSWQFLFLGASLDVVAQGTASGITNSVLYNSTPLGYRASVNVASAAVSGTRQGVRSMTLTEDEKETLRTTK